MRPWCPAAYPGVKLALPAGCPTEFCGRRRRGYSALHEGGEEERAMVDGTEQGAEAAGVWSTVEAALTTWHAAHPAASFEELETAVEEQVGRLRAQLLGERV